MGDTNEDQNIWQRFIDIHIQGENNEQSHCTNNLLWGTWDELRAMVPNTQRAAQVDKKDKLTTYLSKCY